MAVGMITTNYLLPLLTLIVVVSVRMDCDIQNVSAEETLIRCIETEREALLRFKQGLTDESGIISWWWRSDDDKKECCKWMGVGCSNTTGHVVSLHLDYLSLGGKINSALLELRHLKYLDLSYNDFGGIRIPEFIGSIKSLQHLYLTGSNFSGSIPPQLGNLTDLRTLDLGENIHIWSDNLHWLSHLSLLSRLDLGLTNISADTNWLQNVVLNLPRLQELKLYGCMLADVTKSSASLFIYNSSSSTSLSVLDLSSNQLTSSTFYWLFNISSNFVTIDLSENLIKGPIPDAIGDLIFLKSLFLFSNMLQGGIPDAMGKLIFLEELNLSGNMLQGGIPKSLGNLSHLQYLYLSRNGLGEPLEELLGKLSCTQLVQLVLSNTQLTGSVSAASLGQLSKLKYLDVSYNSLQGTISEAHFINLGNLEWLHLSFNSLTLDLSRDWIPPIRLEDIRLASCKLGPSFPTWLRSTQSNVLWLDLSSNGISDEVPKWFWSLSTHAEYLNLSHNQMSGPIPDLSSTSNFLRAIDVSFNKFSGPLPLFHPIIEVFQLSQNRFSGSITSICAHSYSNLKLLDLSNNKLVGVLPTCWENKTSLKILNLNNNNISGEIPRSFGALSNLKTLHMRNNILSGELPSTLENCLLLQLIDLGGNRLTGNIPLWLGGNHTNMAYLSLRQNRFYGDIPPEICNLSLIQMLDLSGNNVSGKIPKCFNSFTSLVDKNTTTTLSIRISFDYDDYIDYALVQWKGQELEYRNTLGLLKLIDLSSNRLVGNIPNAFSSLRGLISLNLSRNSLTGNIDPNIGQMEMLECLDLSRNKLSGEIPISLAQLNYLAVLDLANNSLSGKIPLSTQLQGFNASAYAGNSELCGLPLVLCPEDGLIPSINNDGENSKEKNDGFMGLSFMQEFGISAAFGFIVGFWGVVGTLLLKTSWRSAYFNFLDTVGDWLYMTTTILFNKSKQI